LSPEQIRKQLDTLLFGPMNVTRAGFFRTELLINDSTTYAQPSIDDYAERTKEIVAAWKRMDGIGCEDPRCSLPRLCVRAVLRVLQGFAAPADVA